MIPAPQIDVSVLAPIGFAAIGSMAVLVVEVLLSRKETLLGRPVTESYIGTLLALGSIGFLALAFYVAAVAFASGDEAVFLRANPMFQLDPFSSFMTAVLAVAGMLTCALSISYLAEIRMNHGEFYALVLLAAAGMMLLVGSVDLLTLFLGFELTSIPVYVLAGFDRRKLRSNESSLKYFVIGAFASAVMLYGMALLYGATGTTDFAGIRAGFAAGGALATVGVGLVIVGFGFKVAAVPFHQWAPDVYEGAPSSVTAFMSVAVKTAAFAGLLRLLATTVGPRVESLGDVLWLLSALSMVVGNVMAVIQDNVKRMLAYSSIAHAGYLLVGLATGGADGFAAVCFYLLVYTFMNLGAFGVVVALARRGGDLERIDDFAGLAQNRPALAAAMALFMFALAGVPGTAGFMAKFQIVVAAVRGDMIWLPILLVVTSIVSVFYYLRIPVLMYMRESTEEATYAPIAGGEAMALGVCAVAVLFFGFFPSEGSLIGIELPALDWAGEAVKQFFAP